MKLELIRHTFTDKSAIGSLSIDGIFECYTLERPDDGTNAPTRSAIVCGTYPVNLAHSEHFGRVVPHILNVPGRSDIEIHVANKPEDIHGCVGVGTTKDVNFVGQSMFAFNKLMDKLLAADTPITITFSRANGRDNANIQNA